MARRTPLPLQSRQTMHFCGPIRRKINIFNLWEQTAGCFRETKKHLEKTIRHLEKTTKPAEKITKHLVCPENGLRTTENEVKTMEKAPAARLSPSLQCKDTTFFSEKQIAPSAF